MWRDPERCHRAIRARDARFDGAFFFAVETTGIYCRPICPARTPRKDRCRYYPHAAAAEAAGYRACFRCRPELAPTSPSARSGAPLAARALARIEEGFLDDGSIPSLAAALDVSPRMLRRATQAAFGVSPTQLAQTRRLALAKRLLQDSALPITQVAFAAGFRSVSRFNTAFRERFGRPPRDVRRGPAGASLTLRLAYRPPIEWEALLSFLARRALPGLERIEGDAWHRLVRFDGVEGEVVARKRDAEIHVDVPVALVAHLPELARRVRGVFDLDADPAAIVGALSPLPSIRRSVAEAPGLRIAGAFDGFETAVRTVLGQQVSVTAASTLAGRLVKRFGPPSPARLTAASVNELRALGLTTRRAETLRALAVAWPALDPHAPVDRVCARLEEIRGIGPWTSGYLAMRWLRWPDAFPAGDRVLQRALGVRTARQAERAVEGARPFRAYAAQHLWRIA